MFPNQFPFSFFKLTDDRSFKKPRTKGVTMMIDIGYPNGFLQDHLDLIAPYVDYGKIETATSRIYPLEYLKAKVVLYKKNDISPFIGGVFLEKIFNQNGIKGLDLYLNELQRFKFEVMEVSDNYGNLSKKDRHSIIRTCINCGFEVLAEVGLKDTHESVDKIVSLVNQDLETGAKIVIIEGSELFDEGQPNHTLIEAIRKNFNTNQIMFELNGPWIPGVHLCDTYKLLVFLIDTFGPDVNIGNVDLKHVFETENDRLGLHSL